MATVVLTLSGIIYLLAEPLLSLYITDSPEAITYGIIRMTYINLFYVLLGLMDSTTGALRGLGYSLVPMFITLLGACGLRIVWVYTVFQKYHTIEVLYQSYPISWIVTFAVEIVLFLLICSKKARAEKSLPQRSAI